MTDFIESIVDDDALALRRCHVIYTRLAWISGHVPVAREHLIERQAKVIDLVLPDNDGEVPRSDNGASVRRGV